MSRIQELEPYGQEQLQSFLSVRGLDTSDIKADLARQLAQATIAAENPSLGDQSAGYDAGKGSSGWSEQEDQQVGKNKEAPKEKMGGVEVIK